MCMLSNPVIINFGPESTVSRIQKFAHSPDFVLRSWKLFLHCFFDELNRVWRDLRWEVSTLTSRETFAPRWSAFSVREVITRDTLCFICDRLVIHQHVTSGHILIHFLRSAMILPHYNTSKLREKRNREFNPEWALQISSRCYLKERRKNDFDQFAMKSSLEHSRTLVGDL